MRAGRRRAAAHRPVMDSSGADRDRDGVHLGAAGAAGAAAGTARRPCASSLPPSVEANSTEVAFSAPPAAWPKVASTTVRPLAASWAPAVWPPAGSATSCQSVLPTAARCTANVQPGRAARRLPGHPQHRAGDDLQRVRRAARLPAPSWPPPSVVRNSEFGAEGVAHLRGGEPQAADQVAGARAAVGLGQRRPSARECRPSSCRRRWCARSRCTAAAPHGAVPSAQPVGVADPGQVDRAEAGRHRGRRPVRHPTWPLELDVRLGAELALGAGRLVGCCWSSAPGARWCRRRGGLGGRRLAVRADQRGADQGGGHQHRHQRGGGGRQQPAAARPGRRGRSAAGAAARIRSVKAGLAVTERASAAIAVAEQGGRVAFGAHRRFPFVGEMSRGRARRLGLGAQQRQAAADDAAHGALPAAEVGGDLGVGQARVEAQHQHRALLGRQAGEQAAYQFPVAQRRRPGQVRSRARAARRTAPRGRPRRRLLRKLFITERRT